MTGPKCSPGLDPTRIKNLVIVHLKQLEEWTKQENDYFSLTLLLL
jgi:hypothetical protein